MRTHGCLLFCNSKHHVSRAGWAPALTDAACVLITNDDRFLAVTRASKLTLRLIGQSAADKLYSVSRGTAISHVTARARSLSFRLSAPRSWSPVSLTHFGFHMFKRALFHASVNSESPVYIL